MHEQYVDHEHRRASSGWHGIRVSLRHRIICMQSAQSLNALFHTFDRSMAILDRSGLILAVNDAWEQSARDGGNRLARCGVGADYLAVCRADPNDPLSRQAAEGIADVIAGRRATFSLDYPGDVPDGRRWFRLITKPLPGTEGHVATIHADVTLLHAADEEARRMEQRYASFLEHALDLIAVIDTTGIITYLSPAVTPLLGYEDFEMVGHDGFSFVHADDRANARDAVQRIVSQPFGTALVDVRIRHRDGEWRYLEARITNLLDDEAVGGIVVNARDVTDRNMAMAELREQRRTLRLALEAGRMAVWDWDTESKQIVWSGLENLANPEGWAPDAFCPDFEQSARAIHPDDRQYVLQADQRSAMQGWELFESEYRLMTATGDGHWLYERGIGVEQDDSGQVSRMVGIAMDIEPLKAAQAALAEQAESFQTLFHSTAEGMIVHDAGRCVAANAAFAAMVGVAEQALIGRDLRDFAAPELRGPLMDGALWEPDVLYDMLACRADGSMFPVELLARPIRYDGRLLQLLSVRDVTARRQLEESVRASEARFRALVQEASDIVIVFDADGSTRYANPALARVLGYPIEAFEGPLRFDLVHPDDVTMVTRGWEILTTNPGHQIRIAYRTRHADGTWVWFDGIATNRLNDPAVQGIVLNLRDISEHKRLEADLRHHALHDPLTSLPNRALLSDRLDYALLQASEHGDRVAVMFIDLDYFKQVNDAFSHAAGDALLRAVAGRLSSALDPATTVARIGGDEFIVLLPRVTGEEQVLGVADRLQTVMATPFRWNDRDVMVSLSIGVALSGTGQGHGDDLLRAADAALYSAKLSGRGRAALYSAGMGDNAVRRLTLESDLRTAAGRGEFSLHYQPIVDLVTGTVHEVEALLRWHHPVYGFVSPDEFIPLAEGAGQMISIGHWVFREVDRQLREWGAGAPIIAVNLSAAQFADAGLVRRLTSLVGEGGKHPGKIHVEITEHTLVEDLQTAISTLDHLRSLGISVAIDDFGTGYSSLRYLRELPVDTIKLDRSFVRGLEADPGALAVVEGITSLAHTVGLSITAEGIETIGQLERLREIGCDRGQGFLIARPAPAASTPPSAALPLD
jgi:diguanylate cyclase (GGDEF)-like protein/PAS domain S-box-containing protein